jgi:alpha-L-rhamnosidase
MLGTHFLFEHLTQEGRNDLVYTMINQDTWPGWGYMLEQGATTVWEQWDGHNSQVHNCYLGGGAWFVRGLGGIRPDEDKPGMQHFLLKPAVIDDLRFSRVRYKSLYGTIVCNWVRSGDSIVFDVHIPCNTYAAFTVPETGHDGVLLNGEPVDVPKRSVLNLSSGMYSIELQ